MSSNLLTTEQLAERLQLSPDTVKSWSREGRIPTIWLSRTVRRFDFNAVLDALQKTTAREVAANA